ncbi:MAG: FimV/HubP family polar landmark protein, partial [Candidatus Contendobacter sp.]
QPAPIAAPPVAAPTASPPAEARSSWISSPIVWVAIALIALAIASVVLLPLLRRPARSKPAVGAAALEFPEGESTGIVEHRDVRTARARIREPGSVRPRPAVGLAATAPAAPSAAKLAPAPAGAPSPKPIGELLKDFDFGLGEGETPPVAAARQGAVPARDLKAPLLDAEPPTASGIRRAIDPFAATPTELAELTAQEKKEREKNASPVQSQAELPSELRLDDFDFKFDDLALGKTARPQSSELPPLDMNIAEPPTKPPSLASTVAAPAGSPMPDLKFEFADITQEIARHGAHEDSLKLNEALQGLGGDTLKRGDKEDAVGGAPGGINTADYVETKLDLASAYMDMGDDVGARSLLEEVLREGDATQKERARGVLNKLG